MGADVTDSPPLFPLEPDGSETALARLVEPFGRVLARLVEATLIHAEALHLALPEGSASDAELDGLMLSAEAAAGVIAALHGLRGEAGVPRWRDAGEAIARLEPLLHGVLPPGTALTLSYGPGPCPVHLPEGVLERTLLVLVEVVGRARPPRVEVEVRLERGTGDDGEATTILLAPWVPDEGAPQGAVSEALLQRVTTHGLLLVPGDGSLSLTAPVGRRPEPQRLPALRGAERVLLIEDDQRVSAGVRMGLERLGYAVEAVSDLAAARRRLDRGPAPDVVVLDLLLPDGSGIDITGQVRERFPQARIILSSGFPRYARARLRLDEADLPFLAKPFTPAALAAVVRTLCAEPEA